MRTVAILIAVALTGFAAEPAHACSVGCTPAWSMPADGGTLAANAPMLVVTGSSVRVDGGLVLVDADGGRTPLSTQSDGWTTRATLPTPLQVGGHYSLEFEEECGPRHGLRTATFVATAEAPLPGTVGTVAIRKSGHGEVLVESDGLCMEPVHAAYVQLRVDYSNELIPFLPVTNWRLEVSPVGTTPSRMIWARGLHGALAPDGRIYTSATPFRERDVLLIHGICQRPGPPTSDEGLMLGTYDATMLAQVAGTSTELKSAPVRFSLSCDGAQTAIEPYRIDDPRTPTSTGGSPAEDDEPPTPGKCSVAGGELGALALMCTFVRRRRRS